MARKSLLKRAVSSFTALAIATVTMPVIPAFAETGSITYSFDGYDVEYLVKNEWTEGQSVEVKITNTGDEPILNWAFKYDAEGVIDGLWNASVYDTKETSYIIKNVGWNYEIAPDASVSFGYTLSDYNGTNPDKFELCAKRVDKTDGYDVQYNITNEWDTGLQGEIVITNTSEEPLEAWELSFDSTFEINNLWDGRIISAEENHYVVASEMWSNPIDAGGSKTVGFTGSKQADDDAVLSNFSLSVVIIADDGNSGGTGGNTGNDDPNPNPDIDVTTDTDSDKMPDAYEEIFGTDKNKPDTDDDGLTDYEEIALIGTDPLVYDSVTEGTSDADADCDGDGLTNKEELTLGTSPTDVDTDFDGLTDYDEIYVYNTDPLNPDTDGDGISDGDEIKLGTDPNSDTTDGVKDTERVTHQVIGSDSDVFSYLNDDDNPLKISVEIDAAGLAKNCLTVDKSKYYHAIENSAVVGVIPEFEYADGLKVENMTIKFEVDETARANKIGSYAKECAELEGIKRLNVFEYFDDIGVLLPIETHHDVENNIVYAETAEMGTYCVLDMEIWFKNLGIDPISTDENIEVSHIELAYNSPASLSDENSLNNADATTREKVDLALCLDTRTCVSSSEFSEMKQAIKDIVNLCYDNKLNVGDIYVYYQNKNTYQKKQVTNTNLSVLDSITRSVDAYYVSNNQKVYYFDQTAMLEYAYNNIGSRETVLFFISNKDDIVCSTRLADKVKATVNANADRVHIVMIGKNMYVGRGYYSDDIVKATNGLVKKALDEYTVGDVLQTYLEPTSYKILLANKFEDVELKGMLRKLSDIDTDYDKLNDWGEINFDVVNLFKPNPSRTYCFNSQFPTIQEYIDYKSTGRNNLLLSFDKYEPFCDEISLTKSAPSTSSPVLPDTDFDGIKDFEDEAPNDNNFVGLMHYKHGSEFKTCEVNFQMDYETLMIDGMNTNFSKELANMGIMFASEAYDENWIELNEGAHGGADDGCVSLGKIFDLNGELITISEDDYSEDKDDTTQFYIGWREINYNDRNKLIVFLSIRGTNASNAEWSSNFDVGADTDEYYTLTGKHNEWKNKLNHKGFDVTANRVIDSFNEYAKTNFKNDSDMDKIIFVTGHSRGGAIANIVGTYFDERVDYTSFTYTYAAPFTTTDVDCGRYHTINNIMNSDDLIAHLPLYEWGFRKYGKLFMISVADNYEYKGFFSDWFAPENSFEKLCGFDYNNDGGTQRTLEAFGNVSENREGLYIFDETADGKVNLNNTIQFSYEDAVKEMNSQKERLDKFKLGRFCRLSVVSDIPGFTWHVETNYCPAYLLQNLVIMTTNEDLGEFYPLGFDVKGKYSSAKWSFVFSSGRIPLLNYIGGMDDPHMQPTYYLIVHYTMESAYKKDYEGWNV